MRNIFSLIGIMLVASLFNLNAQKAANSKKILIAYFSHSGNTKVVAEQIQKATGADIFVIQPVKDYPTDYKTVVDQAKKEINADFRPELKSKVVNFAQYDIIIVGSPNWWTTIAPPVATFLSSYNFEGKTIVPFITHEGSGLGRAPADIHKLCPDAAMLDGLAIRGSNVNSSNENVINWLKRIKVIN